MSQDILMVFQYTYRKAFFSLLLSCILNLIFAFPLSSCFYLTYYSLEIIIPMYEKQQMYFPNAIHITFFCVNSFTFLSYCNSFYFIVFLIFYSSFAYRFFPIHVSNHTFLIRSWPFFLHLLKIY